MAIESKTETSRKRTQAATEARMRKSEQRWAQHLRGRGYAVVEVTRVESVLSDLDVDTDANGETRRPADAAWIRGFHEGMRSVVELSDRTPDGR